jgi:hypothetical protein
VAKVRLHVPVDYFRVGDYTTGILWCRPPVWSLDRSGSPGYRGRRAAVQFWTMVIGRICSSILEGAVSDQLLRGSIERKVETMFFHASARRDAPSWLTGSRPREIRARRPPLVQ